jgi:hypothetical protein
VAGDARDRLGRLLRHLKPDDQVALIAYQFRKDPPARLKLCQRYAPSLVGHVEAEVQAAEESERKRETLKKRSQRAAARARQAEGSL